MNLTESLALIGASVVLLILGRGRGGEGLQFLRKLPWVAGQFFAMAILYIYIFAAGLMGVAAKLHWLG
jgi:Na+/H+ antiporter NhaD/arsenite permease-like protein